VVQQNKSQIDTNNAIILLGKFKEKIDQTEHQINPELVVVRQAKIAEKLNLLGQTKIMDLEAQHSINVWYEFT
jgi:hypothetical protein